MRALGAQRRVVTVPGVDNGLVAETGEDLGFNIVEQGLEHLTLCCPSKTHGYPVPPGQLRGGAPGATHPTMAVSGCSDIVES